MRTASVIPAGWQRWRDLSTAVGLVLLLAGLGAILGWAWAVSFSAWTGRDDVNANDLAQSTGFLVGVFSLMGALGYLAIRD